jgi:PAP2 superfamily
MTRTAKHARTAAALVAVAAVLALTGPASARADVVTDWNGHATNALIVTAGQSPTVSTLHLAMVHGAVYDAVNAIDRRHDPYLVAPQARRWYSKDAAAATAAYRVLSSLVPAQQGSLDALYTASLDDIPAGNARAGGIAVGDASAAVMLAARADDGRFGPFRFPVGFGPGQWRPVPPALGNDPFAWVARVKPFLVESATRFRSDGPNPITSKKYAREFAEVKALGSLTGSARTADQTDMARFWAEHPAAMWSRVFRALSSGHELRTADSSRLFAMLYLTAADSLISCWDDKAHWLYWRPMTAIREADADGNPATEADAAWTPLIGTPPYPDHPSGHACLSSSIVRTLRDFFGTDRAEFSALSATSGTTRSFTRFSQAIDEIIDARVYSGIHFRIADEQGAEIGTQVARWREKHFFRESRR